MVRLRTEYIYTRAIYLEDVANIAFSNDEIGVLNVTRFLSFSLEGKLDCRVLHTRVGTGSRVSRSTVLSGSGRIESNVRTFTIQF